MKFFLGLVEFSCKKPLRLLGAFSAPLPPVSQKMLSALESLLRSSESGGREEGAGSLGKESGFAHCGQITVILSLCYLRPLRPEVYFVFENEPTSPSSYPIWVLSPFSLCFLHSKPRPTRTGVSPRPRDPAPAGR